MFPLCNLTIFESDIKMKHASQSNGATMYVVVVAISWVLVWHGVCVSFTGSIDSNQLFNYLLQYEYQLNYADAWENGFRRSYYQQWKNFVWKSFPLNCNYISENFLERSVYLEECVIVLLGCVIVIVPSDLIPLKMRIP